MSEKKQLFFVIRGILIAVGALLVAACGGGGGGSSSSNNPGFSGSVDIASLDGTWSGSLEDPIGGLHTYQTTVSAGAITQIIVDGVDIGETGTITKESNVIFSVAFSDGTVGGFIVDSAAIHAAIVDDAFSFGVIQKGTGALPTFLINDTDGSWSGHTAVTDFVTFTEFVSSGSCANLACTATGNGVNSNVDLTLAFDATYGRWDGTYTNSLGDNGFSTVMLSIDKQFAASYGCDSLVPFPDGCDFSAWVKQ